MNSIELSGAIKHFILDPKDPFGNFYLGQCYESLGQTASAVSFYVRTTEFGADELLTYEALLRVALCLERQGSRTFLVKGILLRAVSLLPDRPEAYFLLSRIYERNKDWQESYTWAKIGYNKFYSDNDHVNDLHTDVEYPGSYGFKFEMAVSSWWIGLKEEAIHLFKVLSKMSNVSNSHKESIINNLKSIWNTWKNPIRYDESMYNRLKFKFEDSNKIQNNYSQCYQDMFVLSMLNGKSNGRFIEIGCGDPFFGNNTALLETKFNWQGISIDINKNTIDNFSKHRKSKVICEDATKIKYNEILDGDYDYLQIDCDPAIISLTTLKSIPFDKHRFAVITFEHDFYNGDNAIVRDSSREYLKSIGYVMIVNNISADKYYSFEDWWVHPNLVDKSILEFMTCISDNPKKADMYMLS